MVITGIQEFNNKKYNIYIDEVFAFRLYKGEVRRYRLSEGETIDDRDYEEIVQVVLYKRCRERALHLLNHMNRTESQLRGKLHEGGYPDEVIDRVIEYVKEYHYIDDFRYASGYLRSKGEMKSVRLMTMELKNKGIGSELIEEALANEDGVNEPAAIRRWMDKKRFDPVTASREQLRKFYQFLLRKGFRYEEIRRVVGLSVQDNEWQEDYMF